MANTYSKMYIQTVFSPKYRKALIRDEWKHDLFAVMGNLINKNGGQTLIINGVEDHVHCFFVLKAKVSVSALMQIVKGKSSKFINDEGLTPERFSWQIGFGCFSYSHSHINNVIRYIENQEEHHRKTNFKDEYKDLLNKFEIDYDEDYLPHDPI